MHSYLHCCALSVGVCGLVAFLFEWDFDVIQGIEVVYPCAGVVFEAVGLT